MPIWNHNCDQCQYLGSGEHDGKLSDFYRCDGSLVIRTGNESNNYASSRMDPEQRIVAENLYKRILQ